MDLCGLEEGHHEGLLVLGSVAPNQARQLGVDALPCKGGIRYRGVQGEGRGRGMILASPYNPFTATHSSGKDCLGNFRSCLGVSCSLVTPGSNGRQHTITQW